jgi:MinD superfamily P-loop ATPase
MEIAIISGKGGTGKSSVAGAFASIAGNLMLVDCDVDAANLYLLFNPVIEEESIFIAGHKARIDYDKCSLCGECAKHCAFDAISLVNGDIILNEINCDGCYLCYRICPANAITMVPNDRSRLYSGSFRNGKMVYGKLAPGEENSGKMVHQVRKKAMIEAEASNLDIILLDGPPGIGCPVISTITGADTLVLVTEPTLSGFSDLKRTVTLASGYSMSKYVVINKADLNPEVTNKIQEWCEKMMIKVAGRLPYDAEVVNAMVHQKTIVEWAPDSYITKELEAIWSRIMNFKAS